MKLTPILRTNITVSNREAGNVFLSYLPYVLGGVILAGVAVIPIYAGNVRNLSGSTVASVLGLFMLDYLSVQIKLGVVTLIDESAFRLFPLSRIRSIFLRFFLFMLDKRILYYALPLLAVLIALAGHASLIQLLAMLFLFVSLYVLSSEIFFLVFIAFKKLANLFSAKTVTQAAIIPIILVSFLLSAIPRNNPTGLTALPIVSEFSRGFHSILASNAGIASLEAGHLLLISLFIGVVFLILDSFYARSSHHLRTSFAARGRERNPFHDAMSEPGAAVSCDAKEFVNTDSTGGSSMYETKVPSASRSARRLVFLDWKIHQKEERIFFLLLMYPFLAIMMMKIMNSRFHQHAASMILPIFFVTQLLGAGVTEHHFTGHGLRLKHVSIFPLNAARFVYVKSLSTWFLLSVVNLIVSVVAGLQFKLGAYQLLQGDIYSLFLPLVLVQLVNTLILSFNRLSRYSIISLLIVVALEFLSTMIYVLLMLFSFVVGLGFVAALFVLTYLFWIPRWGTKLSLEFQTLLEE
ncbi:MAG: hypothetical protein M1470_14805 [Bacteroidetes bacterium]|nr:hypothetical protein [Bacteroidota bacterium]MCL5737939.1 hypothetical protein [Bacteroidota bacterium]